MFYLADTGINLRPPHDSTNGLASVHPGGIVVFTGISCGPVRVTVDARDAPPSTADTEAWDEVLEVSVHAPVGRMVVSGVFSDAPELPVLTTAGPGDYRVRLHARGRDTAIDLGVLEPVEDYLVIAWPAQLAPETSLKNTDSYGAGRRRARRRGPAPATGAEDRQAALRARLRARLQAEDDKFHQHQRDNG
ncbi:hypothetical protein [Couchioplanes caeruleus]|uniref:Uncharacterized protein n=2 Tax=Couchioplanes caeruleus TaxID=56438 RepID=A0A1K0FRE7_9ACTN|nr:hypothetical protein [Couchioplanes caeruleus]OJF15413.1 hypothetical protein BG844_04755 [Couchioplanes caeruleus subsp. caeruleus]